MSDYELTKTGMRKVTAEKLQLEGIEVQVTERYSDGSKSIIPMEIEPRTYKIMQRRGIVRHQSADGTQELLPEKGAFLLLQGDVIPGVKEASVVQAQNFDVDYVLKSAYEKAMRKLEVLQDWSDEEWEVIEREATYQNYRDHALSTLLTDQAIQGQDSTWMQWVT